MSLHRRHDVYLALLALDADRWTQARPNITTARRVSYEQAGWTLRP